MDVRKLLKYCGKCGEFVCKKSFHSDGAHILVCRSNVMLFNIAVLYVRSLALCPRSLAICPRSFAICPKSFAICPKKSCYMSKKPCSVFIVNVPHKNE